jgi:fimbrial chaperone protein
MTVRRLLLTVLLLAALPLSSARAQEFAALVSPPRFELTGKPGQTVRQVFELTNRSSAPAKFHVHTADFTLDANYSVNFRDDLQPGSCRPWVAIERGEVSLPPGGTIRYRFEMQVPKDAPPGECRFAILIDGEASYLAKAGAMQLPVLGRIGIITYLRLGDAKPHIEIFGPDIVTVEGQKLPALRVHNDGDAHTRTSGFLSGRDATGKKYDFVPSDMPILPGEDRVVYFRPATPEGQSPALTFPVTVRGTLEWDDQTTDLDERFK